jgi:CDP-paratose synthetase
MKILVTGASGFLGSNLIPRMLAEEMTVAAFVRKSSNLDSLSGSVQRIKLYSCDSYKAIERAMEEYLPDVVIHLATHYVSKHSYRDIDELIDSNIRFGALILEAMAAKGIKRILNIGTRWQHLGDREYDPANLYSATKEAFKDILGYYQKTGIEHKTLELCDTFGEGDTRGKIVELLVRASITGNGLELSPGEQMLDIVYVGDVCEFICSGIKTDGFFDGSTDSLSGTEIRLRELGGIIESISGNKGLYRWGAKPYRMNEVMMPPAFFRRVVVEQRSLESRLRAYMQHVKSRAE